MDEDKLGASLKAFREELRGFKQEVKGHLEAQDRQLENVIMSQTQMRTVLTGDYSPKEGLAYKVEQTHQHMQNQKWVVRTAVTAMFGGLGLSFASLLFWLMHLPH